VLEIGLQEMSVYEIAVAANSVERFLVLESHLVPSKTALLLKLKSNSHVLMKVTLGILESRVYGLRAPAAPARGQQA